MSKNMLASSRAAARAARLALTTASRPSTRVSVALLAQTGRTTTAAFSTQSPLAKGILPDSDSPAPQPAKTPVTRTRVELSDVEYHGIADSYLVYLVSMLENLSDKNEEIDVEFSVRIPTSFLFFLLPIAIALRLKPSGS